MRNGNLQRLYILFSLIFLFLSYLWGMETIMSNVDLIVHQGSYPTYEEWKPVSSFIVTGENLMFLSYLWGMETLLFLIDQRCYSPSSYPTYEEWKPQKMALNLRISHCSYPTYEEWKHPNTHEINLFGDLGSYPTYEEWKHIKKLCHGNTL